MSRRNYLDMSTRHYRDSSTLTASLPPSLNFPKSLSCLGSIVDVQLGAVAEKYS